MSDHLDFTPTYSFSVPVGEGAFERIVTNVRRFDLTLAHFSIVALKKPGHLEPDASLDSLPHDSALRDPLSLPMPHTDFRQDDFPPALVWFNHTNAHEITPFLQSLHHSIHGAANFATYAVVIVFAPGYVRSNLPEGCRPERKFNSAPDAPSYCVVAVSGNRIAFFSPEQSAGYLQLFNRHSYAVRTEGYQPVEATALLPYVEFAPHTFDQLAPQNISIGEPDATSIGWMKVLHEKGIALPSHPTRIFDLAAFEAFKTAVQQNYVAWLAKGLEHRWCETDIAVHRFGRTRSYMRQRYPRLRDWMNYALTGDQITTPPSWDTQSPIPPYTPINEPGLLADFMIGPDPDDEGTAIPECGAVFSVVHPNWLSKIVADATHYVRQYFLLTAHKAAPKASFQTIERDVKYLLVDLQLLKALLTEIGDAECKIVEASMSES